jgi:hypothetical protein
MSAQMTNELLTAAERVAECLRTAEWNLEQCSDDCNDRSRALDRLAEAIPLAQRVVGSLDALGIENGRLRALYEAAKRIPRPELEGDSLEAVAARSIPGMREFWEAFDAIESLGVAG